MKSMISPEHILFLHDIRSAENVGSLFRTADAAGITRIYLTGITPTPIDRFGRPFGKLVKASLGAEQTIPWEHHHDPLPILHQLRTDGYQIIAIEQSPASVDYTTVTVSSHAAFILGNEVHGIPPTLLAAADTIAEITMRGSKESLNVAVAGGIALFHLLGI